MTAAAAALAATATLEATAALAAATAALSAASAGGDGAGVLVQLSCVVLSVVLADTSSQPIFDSVSEKQAGDGACFLSNCCYYSRADKMCLTQENVRL